MEDSFFCAFDLVKDTRHPDVSQSDLAAEGGIFSAPNPRSTHQVTSHSDLLAHSVKAVLQSFPRSEGRLLVFPPLVSASCIQFISRNAYLVGCEHVAEVVYAL